MNKWHIAAMTVSMAFLWSCGSASQDKESAGDTTLSQKSEPAYPDEEKHDVVINAKKNNRFSLELGNMLFEVDAEDGARISSLQLNGKEILSGQDVNEMNWGSTFWSSPQSEWGWPPPDDFDRTYYEISIFDNHVKAKSNIDSLTKYSFTKEFFYNVHDTSVVIRYEIINNSDSIKRVAPWEVTRVPPGGLTFYPGDPDSYTSPFDVIDSVGVVWFDYDSSVIQEDHRKLIGDGKEGWIAHIIDDVILLKVFDDTDKSEANFAPGEGEIEIYASPDKKYVEIEPQGPYVKLHPNESVIWEIVWILKKIPGDIELVPGNEDLLQYVRDLVKNTHARKAHIHG